MKRRQVILAAALMSIMSMTSIASAFDRPFPPGTKRGKMTPGAPPFIVLNDKVRELSAGAKIWNPDNLIEVPTALRGKDFVVNYTETEDGQIDRIWILTPDEARVPASALSKTVDTR